MEGILIFILAVKFKFKHFPIFMLLTLSIITIISVNFLPHYPDKCFLTPIKNWWSLLKYKWLKFLRTSPFWSLMVTDIGVLNMGNRLALSIKTCFILQWFTKYISSRLRNKWVLDKIFFFKQIELWLITLLLSELQIFIVF